MPLSHLIQNCAPPTARPIWPGRAVMAARALAASAFMICALPTTISTSRSAEAGHSDSIRLSPSSQKRNFTDAQIIEGFMKTAFGAEFHLAGRVDRIRKYEMPVRVRIIGNDRPDRGRQVHKVVNDVRHYVRNMDIAIAEEDDDANVIVTLVKDRELNRTITRIFGAEHARSIRNNLDPQCLSGFRKNDEFQIERSDIILIKDSSDFIFLDCAYEEMLQSLGPINDTSSVPWTMFNDNVRMGFFGIYDQYIMNILYDPRIHAGMNADEVLALLPQIIPDVRTWVNERNNLRD